LSPVIQFICQHCGRVSHVFTERRAATVVDCQCGGRRQAVRVFSDRRSEDAPVPVERRAEPSD
jgi:hypothetical protein